RARGCPAAADARLQAANAEREKSGRGRMRPPHLQQDQADGSLRHLSRHVCASYATRMQLPHQTELGRNPMPHLTENVRATSTRASKTAAVWRIRRDIQSP